ncbi:MAG: DUF2628 domain-containing protein [Xanthobacteraceae bacterium]
MSVYTVHEPPLRAADAAPNPERFAFVRDGFYFWAFLLTPLWLLWHRLWLVLLIYLVVTFGLEQAMYHAGVASVGRSFVLLLISFLIGLEAATLRRFTLTRRGWKNVGIVGGTDAEAAERRFFDAWIGTEPGGSSGPAVAPPLPPAPASASHTPHIVGLFPEPDASR